MPHVLFDVARRSIELCPPLDHVLISTRTLSDSGDDPRASRSVRCLSDPWVVSMADPSSRRGACLLDLRVPTMKRGDAFVELVRRHVFQLGSLCGWRDAEQLIKVDGLRDQLHQPKEPHDAQSTPLIEDAEGLQGSVEG